MSVATVAETISAQTIDQLLSVAPEDITTLVDLGCEFRGDLIINTGRALLVSGKVVGTIVSTGSVLINAGAEVHGSIRCRSLQVAGKIVRRNNEDILDIEEAIVLSKSARVSCDARAAGLKTEYGCGFNGRFEPRFADDGDAAVAAAAAPVSSPANSPGMDLRMRSSDLQQAGDGLTESEGGGQVIHLQPQAQQPASYAAAG